MPGISFGGMASGLPPNIVEQLIDAEKAPIRSLETKKSKSEDRLKLVNELDEKIGAIRGTIGDLASRKGFNDIKLESGDPNIVQGIVDPSQSVTGSWNIEVLELPQKAAAITAGFPDKDRTEVGVGYFVFETPEGDKEVYIDGNHSTLEGVVDAINRSRIGMRASIINDRKDEDYPYKLMITGEQVGDDSKIEYPTLYFLDGDMDLYFDEVREAKNGVVKVDGFEFEVSDNTVEDVIPGVTLELKQASPGRSINVSVKEDQEEVAAKFDGFVKAMNDVLSFIQNQNRLNENSDTSRTLGGDSLLRSVESRLRRLIQNPQVGISGPIKRLNQLGIQFNRNGTLNFDQEKFNSTLAQGPENVHAFFAGDGFTTGFVPALKRDIATLQNSAFGPVSNRRKSLENKIRQFDDNIVRKEKQLEKKEKTLRRKFAKLEETMSRLKSQGGALGSIGAPPPQIGVGG